jgi:hypothetical protein
MEIKQHKNPSIDIKSSTNIKFIVFILTVIVYAQKVTDECTRGELISIKHNNV